jgi:hypothetical protein
MKIVEPSLDFIFQANLDVAEIMRFGSAGYNNRGIANFAANLSNPTTPCDCRGIPAPTQIICGE